MESFATPLVFIPACALLGLMVGSFLNVVIHRLPKMMERDWLCQCAELREEAAPVYEKLTLATPRSRCPACGHAISALENIPVLSWLFLRGQCSACKAAVSLRYPLVEMLTGLLSALAALVFGCTWAGAGALLYLGPQHFIEPEIFA